MKYCPKCHMELPDEAHFCPGCTYVYPKQEIQVPKMKAICRKRRIAVLLCTLIIGVGTFGTWTFFRKEPSVPQNDREGNEVPSVEELQKTVDENFRTGEDIPYNPSIIYELRNALSDYESARAIFDREPQETYEDSEYNCYLFGCALLYVQDEEVKQVYVDYSDAEDTEKMQYGIYGFNGFSTREEVYEIMGEPDNYGDPQWLYRFDGVYEMPILSITFDESDNVKELYFYHALDIS